ncbi:MAG: Ppx/GppA family phosphatase [Alphaproteobacteria bacterium]|nr:Ppx/GppA family phosphatase [Alphaproteobacteria bacterium]
MEQARQPKTRGSGRRGGHDLLLAALDLGTNNCRLLIAKPERDGNLRIVDSFSRIVRLGEGTSRTGTLSEAAMERTVAALKICAERLGKHHVRHVRAIATEACRRASNAQVLIERVAKETGISLSVVTAAEEARLAAIGCAPLISKDYDGALAFDIGGGSTEVIWLRRGAGASSLRQFASIPLGVMSLAEADGNSSFAAMREAMLFRFAEVRREMDKAGTFNVARHHLLGTSGTVTTLAGVAMNLPRYVRAKVDASWHDCADILAVVNKLVVLNRQERAALGCIGEERAELIVPGCAIYSAIQTVWPCARLRVADRGLREGILRELMEEAKR